MCHEGGCGACLVAAEINGHVMSINSCLVPIHICDGWKITTVEGLGSRVKGYHTLQATLAEMNGSQCGFCSPGWVMNMYSLTKGKKMTMKEIENSFGGNICRCTGYRPILDAFKIFASDAPANMKKSIKDIEDIYKIQSCKNCPKVARNGTCNDLEVIYKSSIPRKMIIELKDSTKIYKLLDVKNIFKIFEEHPNAKYIINGGNTAHGLYRVNKMQVYIDINDVLELHRVEKEKDILTLGANITLSTAKNLFSKYAQESGFQYLKQMAGHIDLVASVPIRNIGTIAGNLMIKNEHREFPSDIFLILETAGAEIHILSAPGSKDNVELINFLNLNMNKKIIYSIVLPALSSDYVYKTYKIMPRAQNAHAIVNAGFLFKLDDGGKVLKRPNIIFGGIRPEFLHAVKTEEFLEEKCIFDIRALKQALHILDSELNPDHVLPDYKPEFRKLLALCLFYKFILSVNPSKIEEKLRSGGTLLERALSSGKQDYETNSKKWPVNQPLPKMESIYQTSGEGEYINDMAIRDNEVFCVFTLAEAPGVIEKIDYEEALDLDGVIAFYSAKDVPGKNTFINLAQQFPFIVEDEILFAEKEIRYAGQPYGMVVADSQNLAQYAASRVKLVYTPGPQRKPIITINDAVASNDKTRISKNVDMPAQAPAGKSNKYKLKGTHECGPQYHFSMETQTCVCVPIENGVDVYPATQFIDFLHANIALTLNIPINNINIKVRRLGGSYGGKLTRANQIACACALACHLLRQPARLVMTIEDNMRAIGKRVPSLVEYELIVDEKGEIQKLDATYFGNMGASFNEPHSILVVHHFFNCYNPSTWSFTGYDVKTDMPPNTWCRAPGSTEGVSMIEHIMDRIAKVTGKDPIEVRIANMDPNDKEALVPMIEDLKKSSDYENRMNEISKYNKENRWKKRGMSLVLMKYPFFVFGQYYTAIAVHARDGSVSITHGGIEMGQGLNTKVAQVAAHILGIDLNMISIKPSDSFNAPNNFFTGGSFGSDVFGTATKSACEKLLKRLQPVREALGGNPSWQELVLKAHQMLVDLFVSFTYTPNPQINSYKIYGATVSEVEIDVLTGQHLIRRVDIIEDLGESLNPKIDVGQIEGAFVMGIGYWTCEDLIYDPKTGGLTNYRTWNYKVPGPKDIPTDFRISFRRNSTNPLGIYGSKTAGEPPMCMSCSIPLAIRQALDSARADAGNKDPWYQLDNCVTVEKILLNSLTSIEDMNL
ncbi:xanthine dehydrogenase-like [Copidosoma floridanum]|uniref:xanthine dehydrogenase-like n=1 Tax=Copidosoma floridanum TaxID=29053 RepID=UPI000C6F9339|nr:xanthine dehydrogenase-like [Copidosoma floridanum]